MNISWIYRGSPSQSQVLNIYQHITHTHMYRYIHIYAYMGMHLYECVCHYYYHHYYDFINCDSSRDWFFFFFFVVNFAPNLGLKLMAPDQELDVLLSEPARRSQNRLNSWLGSRLYENSEVDPNCNPPQIFMECQQQRWHRCSHEGLQKKHSIGSPTMSVQPS